MLGSFCADLFFLIFSIIFMSQKIYFKTRKISGYLIKLQCIIIFDLYQLLCALKFKLKKSFVPPKNGFTIDLHVHVFFANLYPKNPHRYNVWDLSQLVTALFIQNIWNASWISLSINVLFSKYMYMYSLWHNWPSYIYWQAKKKTNNWSFWIFVLSSILYIQKF